MTKNNIKQFFKFLFFVAILSSCRNANKDVDLVKDTEAKVSYSIYYDIDNKRLVIGIDGNIGTIYVLIFDKKHSMKELKITLNQEIKLQIIKIIKDQTDLKAVLKKGKVKNKSYNAQVTFIVDYSQYKLEAEYDNIEKAEDISVEFDNLIEKIKKRDKEVKKFFLLDESKKVMKL